MTKSPPIIRDPEVLALVRIFDAERERREPKDTSWAGSPFAWLTAWPSSRTRGAVFESVVHRWCEGMGLRVERAKDGDADRVINGRRFEIKGSTAWGAAYKFQQLRDQDYDAVICLGVSPFDAHCWMIPKGEILARWAAGEIRSRHGGRRGRDTAWLWIDPNAPAGWLSRWGGALSEAKRVLRGFLSE